MVAVREMLLRNDGENGMSGSVKKKEGEGFGQRKALTGFISGGDGTTKE